MDRFYEICLKTIAASFSVCFVFMTLQLIVDVVHGITIRFVALKCLWGCLCG